MKQIVAGLVAITIIGIIASSSTATANPGRLEPQTLSCKPNGRRCNTSSECCGGYCNTDGKGACQGNSGSCCASCPSC